MYKWRFLIDARKTIRASCMFQVMIGIMVIVIGITLSIYVFLVNRWEDYVLTAQSDLLDKEQRIRPPPSSRAGKDGSTFRTGTPMCSIALPNVEAHKNVFLTNNPAVHNPALA